MEIQNIFRYIGSFEWTEVAIGKFLDNKQCSHILFQENFLDKKCLSLSISKTLGYGMIFAACFYKLPVIMKILKFKGGDGLNIFSVYMETSSYLASLFYNVFRSSPISTYGDLCAATLQNFLIITLVWLWGIDKKPFTIFHISSVIFVFGLFTAIVFQLPQEYHKYIATYSIILITLSRLPQILSNFLHGQVGVQSIITITNSVLGATAKLFITIIETNDIYLIAGSALSLLLNSVLLLQIFIIEHQIVKKDPIEISKVNADAADNNKKKDTMIDSKSIKGPKGIRQKKTVK